MISVVPVGKSESPGRIPEPIETKAVARQDVADGVPTFWLSPADIREAVELLKPDYALLHDLFAIDERLRQHRDGQPVSDFTVVYHLMSLTLNACLLYTSPSPRD